MRKRWLVLLVMTALAGCNDDIVPGPDNAEVDDQSTCGNGILDAGEACDTKLETACTTFDADKSWKAGGKAACSDDCKLLSVGTCEETTDSYDALCGNGILDAGEACDTKLETACTTFDADKSWKAGGKAACSDDCKSVLVGTCEPDTLAPTDACVNDTDCATLADRPHCQANQCVACIEDADCADLADTPICNTETFKCEAKRDVPDDKPKTGVTTGNVYIRKGPGTDYEIITSLSPGVEFVYIEESNGWLKIIYNGEEGWISKKYAEVHDHGETGDNPIDTPANATEKQIEIGKNVIQNAEHYMKLANDGGWTYNGSKECSGEADKNYNCSSYAYWAWSGPGGISNFTSNSAADQSKFCEDLSCGGAFTSEKDLIAGDLLFYKAATDNGRHHGINHVAIYDGKGGRYDGGGSSGVVHPNDLISAGRTPGWWGRPSCGL